MNIIILWMILRILISACAGLVSSLKPITPLEQAVALLPPTSPVSRWLERAVISPMVRWDALWYERIVAQGYSASDGTAQFHPLYPWTAKLLTGIGFSPDFSLLVISSLAGIALFLSFYKLAQLDLPDKDAFFALMLFAVAPPAFVLFAPYPEALFILFAVLCLYFARRKSWWLSGLMGGLAALTRQQGIFLLLPVAWEYWENIEQQPTRLVKQWRQWLSLALIPLGFVIWLLYRAFYLSDLQVKLDNFQTLIYSLLVSPSASKVVQNQQFIWPWQVLYNSILKLLNQPDIDIWVNIIAAALFIALLIISWNRMCISYRIYTLAIFIVSFSFYTGITHPTMGLPRHLFLAFPIFIGLAAIVKKTWIRLLMLGVSALSMFFLVILYALNAWVP